MRATAEKRGSAVTHPGEVVAQLMKSKGVGPGQLAAHLAVTRSTLHRVLSRAGSISPLMANRLALAFAGTSPEYWLGLQTAWDLEAIRPRARRLRIRPIS